MISLLLLALLISSILCQENDFVLFGINTNMSIVYEAQSNCDFDSCHKIVCDILSNTTSAYVIYYPLKNITSCPKLSPMVKVNMINFIFDKSDKMLSPSVCYTFGECLMNACQNFLSSKDSFIMAFTGQCL